MALRLAFMGTPEFSVPTLTEIIDAGHDVAAVYTQPPRASGRGQKATRSPVHRAAEGLAIPVRTPLTFKAEADREAFRALELDAAVVIAYGLILPSPILKAPRYGCFNVHASLLPRWRGAAPIQRAIEAGDEETGVMIMQMERGLDTGPVVLGERTPIGPKTTGGALHDTLSRLGAGLMVRALAALERGGLTAKAQPDEGITYANKLSKAEARLDFTLDAEVLERKVRAFHPFPGTWFEMVGRERPIRLKVLAASVVPKTHAVGELQDRDFTLACGDKALRLDRVQRAGKAPCSGAEFLRGVDLDVGALVAATDQS